MAVWIALTNAKPGVCVYGEEGNIFFKIAAETDGQKTVCNQIRCKITEPWNRKSEWYIFVFHTDNRREKHKHIVGDWGKERNYIRFKTIIDACSSWSRAKQGRNFFRLKSKILNEKKNTPLMPRPCQCGLLFMRSERFRNIYFVSPAFCSTNNSRAYWSAGESLRQSLKFNVIFK